jgi:putative IMPACT (imprinted ancient) family translation regulator
VHAAPGVGGLMRAYGGSAAECLRCAERVPLMAMARLRVRCGFAELARLRAHLREAQAEIECEVFDGDDVQLQLRLPESLAAPMQAWISDLTRGRSEAMRLDCLD